MSHILDTEENFYVATKLCLFHKGKVLTLFEKYPGLPLWRDLPGGKISKADKDHDIFFTLSREIQEELWLEIKFDEKNTELFLVDKKYEHTTKGEVRPFIFLCYRYEIDIDPKIILTEHSSSEWITEDEIGTLSDWRPGFDFIVKKAFTHYFS